jgi:hypothetical protein
MSFNNHTRRIYLISFFCPVAMFKLVHSYVTSTAAIFGTVMLQVQFYGLVLTASAAFGSNVLHGTGMLH